MAKPPGPHSNDNNDHGDHEADDDSDKVVNLSFESRQTGLGGARELCEAAENGAISSANDDTNGRPRHAVSASKSNVASFEKVFISLKC